MNHELRILNGLHRGAAMPLYDEPLVIGASELADIVLVDPGIEERHAKLSRTETGWVVLAESGQLYVEDGPDPQTLVDIAPGGFVRVGQVWMMVAEEGAPWESPPPDPLPALADELEPAASGETASLQTEDAMDASDAAMTVTTATAAADSAPGAGEKPRRNGSNGVNVKRIMIVPLAVVAILSGAGAYAITAKTPEPAAQKTLDIQSDLKSRRPGPMPAAQAAAAEDKAEQGAKRLSPEELRQAFRKRMSDADLLKRFEFDLGDASWSMRGDLDDDETARFERVLKTFMDEHKITFPVNAKVVSADQMLPFRISQVVSGSHASIVTDDGSRLYVGDEYRGVRVVAIQGSRLVFAGKRKIEVNW